MAGESPSWVTLTDDEAIVWTGGPSRIRIAEELLGETIIVLVGVALLVLAAPIGATNPVAFPGFIPGGLAGVGLLVVAIGVGLAGVTYLRFHAIVYIITSDEVYVKRGVVSRQVRNLRLDRIQDCGFRQSLLGRLLGYGDVYVSTAGGSGIELEFWAVPDPAYVNGLITEHLDAVRSPSPQAAAG